MVVEDISFLFKSNTICSPLSRIGGMIGTLLLENLFMIDQYVFRTVLGLSHFSNISVF